MLYTASNTTNAAVFDVETGEKIEQVVSVETYTGELECVYQPLRVNNLDEIDTFKIKFRTVYPIGGIYPCLFHCYGREA